MCAKQLENAVQTLDIAQVSAGIDIANDKAAQLIDLMQEARGGNLLLAKLNSTSSLEVTLCDNRFSARCIVTGGCNIPGFGGHELPPIIRA